ncbi:MAG: hypothetical protein PHD76_14300 [Methylacidiphilales bacterium]|nr:hypothetical protein [Candidatus Methylacidiphilales bacterium]
MKTLRSIHLYIGCIFAPMICFFAATGIMQKIWLHGSQKQTHGFLGLLSTLHTGLGFKTSDHISTLSSDLMDWFVWIMALSLVLNVILGVVMAYKFGHGKTATWCLLVGVAAPLLIIGIQIAR